MQNVFILQRNQSNRWKKDCYFEKKQKQLLRDGGLPDTYEKLDIIQKNAIVKIENSIGYMEKNIRMTKENSPAVYFTATGLRGRFRIPSHGTPDLQSDIME